MHLGQILVFDIVRNSFHTALLNIINMKKKLKLITSFSFSDKFKFLSETLMNLCTNRFLRIPDNKTRESSSIY